MITLYRPYTTLADVKALCRISSSTPDDDDDIRRAINRASRLIDSMTGRFFYKLTYTDEYIYGIKDYRGWQIVARDDGGYLITPRMMPIISVTSLEEDGVALTENTDFYLIKDEGIIERDGANWPEEPRKIKITCELGYDSDDTETPSSDIPGDIADYAAEIAARRSGHYKRAIKNYVSGAAETVDLQGIPPEIEKALRNMRPVVIA